MNRGNTINKSDRYLFQKNVPVTFIFILLMVTPVQAQQKYVINKELSKIECSIKYALIGKYIAKFNDFSGSIFYDKDDINKSAVFINIKVASVQSEYPVLDRIVRSARLLDARQYPNATLQSSYVKRKGEDYFVEGAMELHGTSNSIAFPFELDGPIQDHPRPQYIETKGQWTINRKDFEIFWHKVLDKGGIVVDNDVVMDWTIVAELEE